MSQTPRPRNLDAYLPTQICEAYYSSKGPWPELYDWQVRSAQVTRSLFLDPTKVLRLGFLTQTLNMPWARGYSFVMSFVFVKSLLINFHATL